jgi:heme/copper-type cytochrome/quinol oxidase subunit 2
MKELRNVALISALLLSACSVWAQAPKTIEILAGHDNTFLVTGQKKAIITVKAGQLIKLRVIGKKGTEAAKDGTVHSLTINALKDQGWDLQVKEGVNEYTVVAPPSAGEYTIECTVKCGDGHDDMKMKLVVTP